MDFDSINWDNVYPEEPEVFKNAVSSALETINSFDEAAVINAKKKSKRNTKKYTFLLVASISIFAILSGFAFASLLYKQRMENMDKTEITDYYQTVYNTSIYRYNRALSDDEEERMMKLREEYENQGRFPADEISFIEINEYTGEGICFDKEKGVICIPDTTLSDEYLLEIIDFFEKSDYSISQINDMTDSGELDISDFAYPADETHLPVDDFETYSDSVVYKDMYYSSDEVLSSVAADSSYLYLATSRNILRYLHGEYEGNLIFEAKENERILTLHADNSCLYVSLMNKDRSLPSRLLKLSSDGELLTDYNLSDTLCTSAPYRIATDKNGNLYLKFRDYTKEGTLAYAFDKDGPYRGQIISDTYHVNDWNGITTDEKGNLLLLALDEYESLNLLTIDASSLSVISSLPVNSTTSTIYFDALSSYDDQILMAGYDGFYHMLDDGNSVCDIPGYEDNWFTEGSRFTITDNTLIVLHPNIVDEDYNVIGDAKVQYFRYK